MNDVLVNTHHHQEKVSEFLQRPKFGGKPQISFEEILLGTAGTIRANADFFRGGDTLVIHADNWCRCDFPGFLAFHERLRANSANPAAVTMMTFRTATPETCGIVELDADGIVQKMHEKVVGSHGNLANAAVYIITQEVVDWIAQHPQVSDLSTEVLGQFMGRIASWENTQVHRDIGSEEMLRLAQFDVSNEAVVAADMWGEEFQSNPIHKLLVQRGVVS